MNIGRLLHLPEKASGFLSSHTRMLLGAGILTAALFLSAFIPIMLINAQGGGEITLKLKLPVCLPPDETASIPLVLSNAPKGMSGYLIEIGFADSSIGRIEDVSFPDFGMDFKRFDSHHTLRLAAVDLHRLVEPKARDIELATLTVRGLSRGQTDVVMRVLQVDDDAGDALSPQVTAQKAVVC